MPCYVSARTARLLLVPILLAYGYIALGYARSTPRWNNPDEPAHVNVIRQLATTGTLPVLSPGDWDKPTLDRLTTAWFPNDYEVDGIRYEGHQPPLYYLLAAPVYRLTLALDQPLNRQILALRLFSAAIGAVAVVAAFVVAREAAPDRPVLAVLTAALVAFVPMNTAISAAVNNDALATALSGVTLAALMIGRRQGFSDRWAIGLGVLIGALVLTKLTVYVYIPLILATLLLARNPSPLNLRPPSPFAPGEGGQTPVGSPSSAHGRGGRGVRGLRWPLIASAVALLVCGWWLIRNMQLYGILDPLAMARHDQIVVGQPRWAAYDLESLDFFFRILFRSFWGMFGWMGVVLDDGYYILYLVLTVLGLARLALSRRRESPLPQPLSLARERGENTGLVLSAIRIGPQIIVSPSPSQGGGGRGEGADPGLGSKVALHLRPLLLAATALVFAEVAYYNLTFIQPQGRYLFPALVPIALFLASGWQQLADGASGGPLRRLLWAGPLAGAIFWALGEVHGSLIAAELWSDNVLIVAATVGVLVVLLAPRAVRAWLPDGLCLLLALALGLLDYAALVKFVAPAFPLR